MQRDIFQAIADPTRREIIGLLAGQALSVNDVAENFDISRPAVSKHIKILNECGLVVIRKKGRKRLCRADPRKLKKVAEWTEQYRKFWSHRLDALEALLAEEDEQAKEKDNKT
ncbi:MAG TPA: metalloregulator ArsR/SmtB family transcription factor [Balneolaceae bacterium]